MSDLIEFSLIWYFFLFFWNFNVQCEDVFDWVQLCLVRRFLYLIQCRSKCSTVIVFAHLSKMDIVPSDRTCECDFCIHNDYKINLAYISLYLLSDLNLANNSKFKFWKMSFDISSKNRVKRTHSLSIERVKTRTTEILNSITKNDL